MQQVSCSVDSAASALGVCRASIYNWIREGKIETVKVGRRRLVKVSSIHKLVEAA